MERSYGNPIFKERDADRRDDFAESSNVFRGMTERLDLAFKEKNQAMRRFVESQAEFSRRQEETIRQCIEEMRWVFEKGIRVMRETGEESRRPLQAVSEQVVEQVRQPRPEIPPPVPEMPRQIQEAPIPALGGQGNQPYPNIQQQHFVIGEGQRQHQLMEAATPVADHGHQPQHKYILPARKGNVGPRHQPCPRDFFQPQVPPAQPVRRGLQNQPAQFFNKDHGPALRPLKKIDKDTLRFLDKAKETMGVDADPFPAVSVGVNVADLRSVARNRSLPYAQRNLAAEDLRWVLEAQRSRQSRSVRSDQQRLGGQERITVTRNFSPEGARRYSTGTRSPRMVKPPLRSPSRRWEKISHPKFPAKNPRTLRRRLQRKRAEERKRHQKQVEAEGSSSRRPRQPTKRNMVWNGLRVCVDFRNLNLATPKDEYPMPIADLLVDGVARHKILSFMDGHSGYNQIFIADADVPKTAFRCPGVVGTFEWVVMPFGLKNAGATYQRAMNAIFHDMIGKFMEIYIDDVVVKSNGEVDHLVHLRKSFERMRQHGLKMNPLKCAFGVSAGNFLGYLVHERGLEVDKNKARAVIEAKPPQNKKELQRFLGQVNFLRRFISNLVGKTRVFSPLLKLKYEADFKWEEHHQSAFDMIKRYLSRPPVLVPPVKNKPLILYISAADESIGCLLAQENDKKQEQAVYYLSRCLTQTEVKYSSVEKLCLALFFAAIKLRHYLIYSEVYVVAKTDIVKYMLSRPLLRGRIGKWILALSEFNLKYIPQRAVKGQALADFLADHPCLDVEVDEEKGINLFSISLVPWKLIFDGSSTETMSGAGVVVISPFGLKTQMSFQLDFNCTNNQAEYEALIIGLEMLVELKVSMVEVMGDSQLVLKQLSGEYKCTSLALAPYFALTVQLLEEFDDVSIRHVPRDQNYEANEMAQIASGLRIPKGVMQKVVIIEKRSLPSIHQRGMTVSTCSIDVTQTDWRFPIIQYLKDKSIKVSRKTKMQALNYVLIEDVLYRRGNDELLLRCLGPDESFQMLSDVHDGICGAHQAGIKMRWLIRRHGFFWPSVLKDCIAYAKGCKSSSELNSIVKPWPFRRWAIDLIGKVYPPSSKGHSFIIVATDYFTKWVEVKPMKKVDQSDVIKFINEDIIHRFGLPETITTDQGTVFVSHQVEAFAKEMGFRLLNSTPHYAQANGQAEASNKVVINLLEKMVDDNPRRWHELLSETLWAYRTSQRSSTKMTPFALTYGHDAVLPMELTARSLRVMIQHNLQSGEYDEAMMLELEDLEDSRLIALDRLQAQKLKVAKSYNKRVKGKNLVVGDLVWKAILPLGKKDHRFGKWSPNWEGPFRIHEVLRGGAYWLESLDGELHPRKINGIYLKPYYPTVWEARGLESQEAV
ncbi:hypothetical protein SLEP1_g58805 [Rubroshorea leprosula]|uniref:Uncharacterized protein n=1 Tax=Rubroshorea leprosula TaxID=152421 RepID=A0AAV5MQK8_9ROSI|nr:hypothetical protein SLEP1_g58805 [Rubroshorea leprosula]